jgi:quercetin dioxygenase-like cupin family protein
LLKVPLTGVLSAAIGGLILFVAASVAPVHSPTGTAVAQPADPRIMRNTMLDTLVELEAGVYHMTVAELVLDPRAETPLHMHPGPSVGFVESGRLAITVGSEVATYSTGSAFDHPWDRPHVMANNSDQSSKMLSFELNPVQ